MAAVQGLTLNSSAALARSGDKVRLTAASPVALPATTNEIEIFDLTSKTLVGACAQGNQCAVDYSAGAGERTFSAFVTSPTATLADTQSAISSNRVSVTWMGVSLAAANAAAGPGKPVTITATSTAPVGSGNVIQLFDADSKVRLTYCRQGNICSVSLTSEVAGSRSVVAAIGKLASVLPTTDVQATSDPLTVTWLAVNITGSSTYQIGSTVSLAAAANLDLTATPWSIGILDDKGHLVGRPCKSGNTCTAEVAVTGGNPTFTAVIGTEPPAGHLGRIGQLFEKVVGPTTLINVQAQSAPVKPTRLLWGVDSCKSFTDDPSGNSGLLPQISGILGAPEFWGRYLTDAVCPPLSPTEVAAAHAKHMGILPIYNERDCSNVSGYDTGVAYAAEAVGAAHAIGLPEGRGIAIDIEPSGPACPGAANLDTGLIQGWYDGITRAHYAPIYYGNGTVGSEFATQWCYAVSALPAIGEHSYLWSFQPSLLGGYMKSNAPGFTPNRTACTGNMHAWQYQIGSSSEAAPDVDGDEATSELPLWFP